MITDIIADIIDHEHLTQTEAARRCGMTRQLLWDVLDNRNPKFCTVEKIMNGLGFTCRIDVPGSSYDGAQMLETLHKTNLDYESVREIVEVTGAEIRWEKGNKFVGS